MSVYDRNDSSPSWLFVDGIRTYGIAHSTYGTYPQLTVFNSTLYAAWVEDGSRCYTTRVVYYNGNDNAPSWTSDGNGDGIYKIYPPNTGAKPKMVAFSSKLYKTFVDDNGKEQIRVAVQSIHLSASVRYPAASAKGNAF